jgi:hypothetical protein
MSLSTEALSPVETLSDIEALFAMMRSFKVAIVELPGMRFVLEPEVPQPAAIRGNNVRDPEPVRSIHEDPFLYPDGDVPSFSR